MAVHQLYIKQKRSSPQRPGSRAGDQVIFQLAGRDDESLKVWVATGEPLEGEAEFMVGKNGKPKTLVTREEKTYSSAPRSTSLVASCQGGRADRDDRRQDHRHALSAAHGDAGRGAGACALGSRPPH